MLSLDWSILIWTQKNKQRAKRSELWIPCNGEKMLRLWEQNKKFRVFAAELVIGLLVIRIYKISRINRRREDGGVWIVSEIWGDWRSSKKIKGNTSGELMWVGRGGVAIE